MTCRTLLAALLVLFVAFAAGCETTDSPQGDDGPALVRAKADPGVSPEAYFRPGPIDDERYVLPNGRMVWPAGVGEIVNRLPNDLAISPDGTRLAVPTGRNDVVHIIDTETMTKIQTLPTGQTFSGAVWNAAGDRFWIGGGASQVVYEFEYVEGVAAEVRRIQVYNYPSGLALSPDERWLYVACMHGNRLAVVDLLQGVEVDSIPTHLYALDVKITSDGQLGFVSSVGRGLVTAIDLQTREVLTDIEVGKNPEGMDISPDDQTLYVANSDSDTVSVVDIDTFTEIDTWPLYTGDLVKLGASPVGVAATADRVYVVCSGTNEIAVFDAGNGDLLGRIPTGWYPTNARVDEENGILYYASGKGYGSYGLSLWGNWRATVHALDEPTPAELAELSDHHEEALNWARNFFDTAQAESPIPFEYGQPSEQIKHVIFVLKENKTYDQVLGDLEGTERDPSLLQFGWDITPNQHTMAERFTNCDNLFVEGDVSVLGHLWSVFGMLNHHAEQRFQPGDDYPLPDVDPATRPANGTIFERLLEAGIDFRSYGQIIGFIEDFDRFAPYIDLKYGFWNMGVDDVVKADEIIREWEGGIFPPLIYISLPNDHAYGSGSGAPTPQYLLGDNDAGLGKLVDWLSHSEYWSESAVFVTEDDPQSGQDHIDPHRSIGLVISPWAKSEHISSVLYTNSSIWHTIELILGMEPGSMYNQYAAPMYDCFTMEPNLEPYNAIPNPVPFGINPKGLPFQDYCDGINFAVPDQADRMGEVLWALTHPDVPFPHAQSLSGLGQEDERKEALEYMEAVEMVREYARKHGLPFDALTRRGAP
ncbi:MAG: bifunctional YncE family protein/alkaline phosphatase family protein [Candidatus Lernaella stagnicola]|nr:bifunctional YncE family protein/alkaline phosphatase family protein [Candidatus Lernaella stagnicola]